MPRVLVVDDDPSIRSVVADALRDEGYAVEVAAHGALALEAVQRQPPDAILLDLMMPVMDGWTFARQFHALPGCGAVPILIVSAAHELPAVVEGLERYGVRAVETKPFNLATLLATVQRLVSAHP